MADKTTRPKFDCQQHIAYIVLCFTSTALVGFGISAILPVFEGEHHFRISR